VPLNLESYIHRVGRTARFENNGEAITFYNKIEIEELNILLKKEITPTIFKDFNTKNLK
jgi:superfamily II DNA/RNA helicase